MSETSSSTVPPWQTPEGIASLHNFEVTTLPLSLTLQMDASPLVKERRDLNPNNFERCSSSIARRVGRGPVKGAACARITLGCAWNVVTPSFCLGETFGYPNHLPILDLLAPGAPVSSIPYRSSYLWRTMAAAAEHTAEGDRHTDYPSPAL